WIDALEKRNLMAHTYDEETALEAEKLILGTYFFMLKDFYEKMKVLLLPYMIDIVHLDSTKNNELREHIKRVGIRFFDRSEQI
ncbi:MAG: nucleotidyltransferase substrate binding protein, partial [Fusobacteriaceae bacterium]